VSLVDDIVDLALTAHETCGLRVDATVWCRFVRRDASGPTFASVGPVRVDGLGKVVRLEGAGTHVCATIADGRVACWDDPLGGESIAPSFVPGLDDAVGVALGPTDACAMRLNYGLACWGSNGESGILGDGLSTDSPTLPVTVSDIDDAIGLSVGADRACSIRYASGIACWGASYLGDGYAEGWPTPLSVLDEVGDQVLDSGYVSAGDGYSCLIKDDGQLYCWGSNDAFLWGLVPSGDSTTVTTPKAGLPPLFMAATAARHICVVSIDQDVYCWGDRSGFGHVGATSTPVVVYDSGFDDG